MPRNHKHWLKAYCDYTRFSESPTNFHFWCGVWTVAAALRRKVWRDEVLFQISPNFYIIIVAPAGVVQKSTTIGLGKRLLDPIEGLHFGPDSGSWQGLGDALQASTTHFNYTDEQGFIVDNEPMSALTIASSELGSFLKPDDEGALSFLTDVWDGRKGTYKHLTKHSGGIEVINPWLNVIGATTPEWIQRNIPENMIGEGFMSRVLFVYGDQKRHLVAMPSKMMGSKDRDLEKSLAADLLHISENIAGPYAYEPCVERDGGWMEEWYYKHNTERDGNMASHRFSGYLARKQTHMIKVAMILAASQRDERVILQKDFEEAELLIGETEAAMQFVFGNIGLVDQSKHLAEVLAFVRAFEWIEVKELYHRHCFNNMEELDFKTAIRIGVEGGAFRVETRGGKTGLTIIPPTVH